MPGPSIFLGPSESADSRDTLRSAETKLNAFFAERFATLALGTPEEIKLTVSSSDGTPDNPRNVQRKLNANLSALGTALSVPLSPAELSRSPGHPGGLSAAQARAITRTLDSLAAQAPVNLTVPTISGTPAQGQTLTGTNGTWSHVPTSYTRQWRRNGVNISGATGSTYVVQAGDVGQAITLAVTAVNASGSSIAAVSAPTANVT